MLIRMLIAPSHRKDLGVCASDGRQATNDLALPWLWIWPTGPTGGLRMHDVAAMHKLHATTQQSHGRSCSASLCSCVPRLLSRPSMMMTVMRS